MCGRHDGRDARGASRGSVGDLCSVVRRSLVTMEKMESVLRRFHLIKEPRESEARQQLKRQLFAFNRVGRRTSCSVTVPIPLDRRDDNGSAGHGSSGSTNLSWSRGSRVSTRDPLTDGFVFFRHFSDLRHSLSHNVSTASV